MSETIESGVTSAAVDDKGDTFSMPLNEDEDVYLTGALIRWRGDLGPTGDILASNSILSCRKWNSGRVAGV